MAASNESVRPASYIKLLFLAAFLGLISSGLTWAFIEFVEVVQTALWDDIMPAAGVPIEAATVFVCMTGGLIVGLLIKVFGDHSGIFAEMMVAFGKTGRFEYRHAPGILLTALASLISGGSLGPEAPLADASGGLGTWISDKLKLDARESRSMGFSGIGGMLAAFITSPFGGAVLGLESSRSGIEYVWLLFPSLVASGVATVVFVWLSGSFFGTLYSFPDYVPGLRDLLFAAPLGLLGGLAGAIFVTAFNVLRRAMLPLKGRVVLRGLIGGLALGLAGAILPLILFSGEAETVHLISDAAALGVPTLIVLSILKLLVTALLLATGWKGGYIFPTMFAGAALGLAAHIVFPVIPEAVAVAATMAGAMVATMKAPIFSALFVLVLVQPETAPAVAIAVVASALATWRISMIAPPTPEAAPAAASPEVTPELVTQAQ
jgi:H+/Cl- antiporter ClcA